MFGEGDGGIPSLAFLADISITSYSGKFSREVLSQELPGKKVWTVTDTLVSRDMARE